MPRNSHEKGYHCFHIVTSNCLIKTCHNGPLGPIPLHSVALALGPGSSFQCLQEPPSPLPSTGAPHKFQFLIVSAAVKPDEQREIVPFGLEDVGRCGGRVGGVFPDGDRQRLLGSQGRASRRPGGRWAHASSANVMGLEFKVLLRGAREEAFGTPN